MENELLVRAIGEAGCTYAELAREVRVVAAEMGGTRLRTNASAVAHWVAGTRPVRTTANCVAEALSRKLGRPLTPEHLGLVQESAPAPDPGPPGDVVDAVVRLGKRDIVRNTSVTTAPYSVTAALPASLGENTAVASVRNRSSSGPGKAECDQIGVVRAMTEMFAAIGVRHGGQHGRSAVVQYLTSEAAPLCRAGVLGEKQRQQALTATACLTTLAGLKASDGGEKGLAQQYFLRSLELTEAADNDRHAGFVLSVLAHHGLEVGRPEHTLALTRASLDRVKGIDPATESMLRATRARALAMAGLPHEALTEAARSTELGVGANQAEMPYWAALWGPVPAIRGNQLAKAAALLGDLSVAEHLFAQAAVHWQSATYPATLARANVGFMQCRQGNVEKACATWNRVLDAAGTACSPRLVNCVIAMRKALVPFSQRGGSAAQKLDRRTAVWLKRHSIRLVLGDRAGKAHPCSAVTRSRSRRGLPLSANSGGTSRYTQCAKPLKFTAAAFAREPQ